MIARINTKNGYYDSVVFAIFYKGWKSSALVFNKNYDAVEIVNIWKPKRNVYIYNTEKTGDWIITKKFEGYSWALENITKRFFKTVINQSILDKCKELQTAVNNCEWFDIKNQSDISGLMECATSFHDSYIKDIYTESQKQYILFDVWDGEILFELDGKFETNLFKGYGNMLIDNEYIEIFDSAMFIEDGLIYWIEDETINNSSNINKSKLHYFCASNIKWKLIITT